MSKEEAFKEKVGKLVSAERYYTGVKRVPREEKLEPVDPKTVESFKATITAEEKASVARALGMSVEDLNGYGGALETMLRFDIGGNIRATTPGLERWTEETKGWAMHTFPPADE